MEAKEADFQARFSGIGRLYGVAGLERLRQARVAVIGLGGVGSWTVEALARSGVGHLTLVDLDEVCLSNTNRQLHALTSAVGKAKAQALAERVAEIAPQCEVRTEITYFNAGTAERLLAPGFDVVVDAIDNLNNKCLLIDECRRRGLTIVTCGGAGGRQDPTRIQVADLARTFDDPLLSFTRKRLRQKHGFPRDRRRKWKIDCVFSPEPPIYPQSNGSVCAMREEGSELRLNCESGYGTATFITGVFGFHLAALAVNKISTEPPPAN
jgi:tRNA A37 threonylcarbamoyladenosine dehydratase